MKDLVEIIAKSLVDNPDEVRVNEVQGEQDLILELRVAPEDMGLSLIHISEPTRP